MASLKYSANSAFQTGTLGSGYTSGGVSLVLTAGHGARFPSTGDFWVRVDNEIFKCTARSTDTLTVTGAQDGTSAASHAAAATVTWVLSVSALDQLRADLLSQGVGSAPTLYSTYATIIATTPAVGEAGKMAYCTDSFYSARWSGSVWQWFYNNMAVTLPPTAGWSWDTQGTATETQAGGYLFLNAPAIAGNNARVRYRTAPATPWTVTMLHIPFVNFYNNQQVGITVRGSASGKLYVYGPGMTASLSQLQIVKLNNVNSWNSTPYQMNLYGLNRPLWLRVTDDGTNLYFYFSHDGINFNLSYAEARATYLTPDQFGYFAETQSNSYHASNTLISWVVT